jgi:hypothetical protein
MRNRGLSRRAFLGECAAALGGAAALGIQDRPPFREAPDQRSVRSQLARIGALLRRYRDLHRHFVFEYYPWYASSPWRHWNESGRTPPDDIAASSMPLLGPYDSRSARVLEQHARWIADAGVGSINLSWWGRGGYEDQSVHLVMDVMRAFDIKVSFHLEPYSRERGIRYADDVAYLLREYGERRRWDTLLLLEDADGRAGPVFKTFVTLLSPTSTNCLGETRPVELFVPDEVWREQVARVRRDFAADFDGLWLVADSLDVNRTRSVGFDAGAIGNPYIRPQEWAAVTDRFDRRDVPFSFAVNAGFDAIEPRPRPADPCYRPNPFEPDVNVEWSADASREQAHARCAARIEQSFSRTLAHQADPRSANWRRGFLLVTINSFNEWHEGTAFEPMKSYRDLTPAERRLYHNPIDGAYRLNALRELMASVV